MNVFINRKRVFSLERGQSRAITDDDLRRLSIQCSNGADPHFVQESFVLIYIIYNLLVRMNTMEIEKTMMLSLLFP